MAQPIIRGVQAVGAVDIIYKYNGVGGILPVPPSFITNIAGNQIDTSEGLHVAGFRLDSEFLRAVQQIASSVVIPILGGGGVALTNNNRTGALSLTCTKVSTPDEEGKMLQGSNLGPIGSDKVYDMVFLAQLQQGQEGGDAYGATVTVSFKFCGQVTNVTFFGCTIASVDPVGLAGNDAVTYNVVFNYLSWEVNYTENEPVNPGVSG